MNDAHTEAIREARAAGYNAALRDVLAAMWEGEIDVRDLVFANAEDSEEERILRALLTYHTDDEGQAYVVAHWTDTDGRPQTLPHWDPDRVDAVYDAVTGRAAPSSVHTFERPLFDHAMHHRYGD